MFVSCAECQLRRNPVFRSFSEAELYFVSVLKVDHVAVAPGSDIIREGEVGGPVYTLFDGWAVKYRRFNGGGRQILDILLPGDVIGLSSALLGAAVHSVQAITPVAACVLQTGDMSELFRSHPEMARGLMRKMVEEEERADLRLSLLGQFKAAQRIAYLMLDTFDRLHHRGMVAGDRANGGASCPFPLRRRHIADAAGLSRVHVARTLDELRRSHLADIQDGTLMLFDPVRLAEFAGYVVPRALMGRALL